MDTLETELAEVLVALRRGHEILPFMHEWCASDAVELVPLPDEMRQLLAASTDYRSLLAGRGPVWLQIASGDDGVELVVYRARSDGLHYVLAPTRDRASAPSNDAT